MGKKLQKDFARFTAAEKGLLLGILLVTFAAWACRDYIPGYLFVLATAFLMTVFMYRTHNYIEEKEKEIREKEQMLAELQMEKMRANLLKAISHDLRTPLANISGSSGLMLEMQLPDEKKRELLKNIYEDSQWLVNMVENLLMVSRVDGDHLSVRTKEEVVEEIVSEAVGKVEKRYPGEKIKVDIPSEVMILPMDGCLIEQVLINLMENAILHSKNPGSVEVFVRNTPHAGVLKVKDHGMGIPKDKLSHLFDGCIYSGSDRPDAYRGLGIGLTICKTIIAAHHGTIIGRNHSDGAEFVFTLPKE